VRPESPEELLDYRRHVGDQVRAIRLAANCTQERLAGRAGLEKQAISQIENGHASPRLDTLWRIACALDVTVADLVRQ
jgi:transcriptional regulator with XRE-family HTH domain